MSVEKYCTSLLDNFHKVLTWSTHLLLTYSVFTSHTLPHAMTLIVDPLTLNVCNVSGLMRSNSVPNMSEI